MQNVLQGFAATFANGYSPKERDKRRVFANNACGGGQMLR